MFTLTPGFTISPGWTFSYAPFIPPPTVQYLVVAGGGGGGNDGRGDRGAGGGGAGGYRTATGFSVTTGTPITVTVGAGGTAAAASGVGGVGEASVFSTISSAGGGGGAGTFSGSGDVNSPTAGGSGGGGGHNTSPGASGNTPTTTPSQGNNGGPGGGATGYFGGGGGGAGAVGGSATGTTAGSGAVGAITTIIPNYSISFNGTSQYLSVAANTAFNLSSGNWTIEYWYYPTSYSASNNVHVYIGVSAADKIVIATIGTSGYLYYLLNGTAIITTTTAATLNTWNHLALVKNSTTTTLYLNGISIGTTISVPTSSSKAITVGADAGGALYAGYISNLRIVNGTAVYTSNFAVPTPPLRAITNTSLLTAQSSTIVDNSTNAFTITATGSPTVSASIIPTAYYSGGGGGSGTGGTGGTGGGGTGQRGAAGAPGTANTGGGGGGGTTAGGNSGGSGIVIISYLDYYAAATSTTGSPTYTVTGGYRIYTWTNSGSITF